MKAVKLPVALMGILLAGTFILERGGWWAIATYPWLRKMIIPRLMYPHLVNYPFMTWAEYTNWLDIFDWYVWPTTVLTCAICLIWLGARVPDRRVRLIPSLLVVLAAMFVFEHWGLRTIGSVPALGNFIFPTPRRCLGGYIGWYWTRFCRLYVLPAALGLWAITWTISLTRNRHTMTAAD